MQTRSGIEIEVVARVMASTNSTLLSSDRVTQVVQDSYIWAASLFFWPALQRARQTIAVKNTQSLKYDYYDYPTDFLTDSITRLYIDGIKYDQRAYQDFLDYCDSSIALYGAPDTSKHYFANFGRQFFVYPSYSGTPPANNLIIWGNIQAPPLSLPSDITIFSQWDDAGNEAIVKKAFSILMTRIEPQMAAAEEKNAIGLLQIMWKKITDQNQKGKRLHHPFFQVPDFFAPGGRVSAYGNFSVANDID